MKQKEQEPISSETALPKLPQTNIRSCDLCYKIAPVESRTKRLVCSTFSLLNHSILPEPNSKAVADFFSDEQDQKDYSAFVSAADSALQNLSQACDKFFMTATRAILEETEPPKLIDPIRDLITEMATVSKDSPEKLIYRIAAESDFIKTNVRKAVALKIFSTGYGIHKIPVRLKEDAPIEVIDFNREDFPLLALRMALNQLASQCGRPKQIPTEGTPYYPQGTIIS